MVHRFSQLLLVAALSLPQAAHAFDHTHEALDAVLKAHVKNGRVSYGRLAKAPGKLTTYLSSVANVTASELKGFSRSEKEAFYINAYNALTLGVIIQKKERKSISNIDGAFKKLTHTVAGKQVTLDQIENEILRPTYNDPRLHAVLVCAAVSCPILTSSAYRANALDTQMDRAARRWVRDSSKNRYDPSSKTLSVSKIFTWYGKDFTSKYAKIGGGTGAEAGVRGFISTYLGTPIPTDAKITYLPYDWALNGTW